MIRTLIVDDEPLARRGIRVRLEHEADVEIVGEAEDGFAAIEMIRAQRPDLVFLDVQMPGLDGFETLERVASEYLPMVIFVTAHDAYALKAFDVHATDYLLKPFTEPRFAEALRRARIELVGAGRKHLLRETLSEMERKLDPSRFVRIRRSTIVNADRIREILPDPHGDGDVVMESGAVHRLSRAYRERLLPRGETGGA